MTPAMTPDERREILERVAGGELSPADAEALLGTLEEPSAAQSGAAPQASTIRRVRVEADFGALVIVGDDGVREAEVDGIHTATVDGDTLVISGDRPERVMAGIPGVFSFNLNRRHIGGRRVGRRFHVDVGGKDGPGGLGPLRIRMHPDLELDARLEAGPMSITHIAAPIRARASAGPIRIDDATGPMDVAVNAGAIRIRGRFDHGDSRVRSDAGGIRIELDPASSVRITASAAVGKVIVPGRDDASKGFGSSREAMVGEGAGTLRVETAMGSINVSCDPGEDRADNEDDGRW
jgi:hypothetical protein